MNEISTDRIRNVTLIGHGDAGKTSLAEAILFTMKETKEELVLD